MQKKARVWGTIPVVIPLSRGRSIYWDQTKPKHLRIDTSMKGMRIIMTTMMTVIMMIMKMMIDDDGKH